MDPSTVVIAPWAQYGILGSVVVGLGTICFMQWNHIKETSKTHLADVKQFGIEYAERLKENTESNAKLAHAIDRLAERVK